MAGKNATRKGRKASNAAMRSRIPFVRANGWQSDKIIFLPGLDVPGASPGALAGWGRDRQLKKMMKKAGGHPKAPVK
jgi:hypothetical protein